MLQRYSASNQAVKATSINAVRRLSKMELSDLDEATKQIAETVQPFGVRISQEELVNHFVMAGAGMPSQVGLFDGSTPLLYLGQGSRRLFSTGLAFALAANSSLILIDEIESGLEPHRLCNLISMLSGNSGPKGSTYSQSIFTTHSPIALEELQHDNLYAVTRDGTGSVNVFHAASTNTNVNEELQKQLRSAPSSFLAPRIIICEGHTELGLVKALDIRCRERSGVGLTASGVVFSEAHGSDKMFPYAKHLQDAGYTPCIFMDSDIKSYQQQKVESRDNGIPVFDWDDGNMTEMQVFLDVSNEAVKESIQLAINLKDRESVEAQLKSKDLNLDAIFSMGTIPEQERRIIGQLAHKKSWFKQIEPGKRLGEIILKHESEGRINSKLYKTLHALEKWALG